MNNVLPFKKKNEQKRLIIVRQPYARKGDTVTCENNHDICDFLVDTYIGDVQDLPNQLGNWRQEEPKVGSTPMPRCAICNAKFVLAGGLFHFKNGWHDPHSLIDQYRMLDD